MDTLTRNRIRGMEASRGVFEHVLGILAVGVPIAYQDPDRGGLAVREYPDGRRVTIHPDPDGGVTEGQEVPPNDDMDPDRIAHDLAQGCWTSYRDPEYPGVVIREYPDGRRIIIHATAGGGTVTLTEGREIPPRRNRTCPAPDPGPA